MVDSLGTALLSTKMSGEKKSQYESKAIGMTLKRQTPAKLAKEKFHGSSDEGGVTFPSTDVLFGSNGTSLTSVDTQVSCIQKRSGRQHVRNCQAERKASSNLQQTKA